MLQLRYEFKHNNFNRRDCIILSRVFASRKREKEYSNRGGFDVLHDYRCDCADLLSGEVGWDKLYGVARLL